MYSIRLFIILTAILAIFGHSFSPPCLFQLLCYIMFRLSAMDAIATMYPVHTWIHKKNCFISVKTEQNWIALSEFYSLILPSPTPPLWNCAAFAVGKLGPRKGNAWLFLPNTCQQLSTAKKSHVQQVVERA